MCCCILFAIEAKFRGSVAFFICHFKFPFEWSFDYSKKQKQIALLATTLKQTNWQDKALRHKIRIMRLDKRLRILQFCCRSHRINNKKWPEKRILGFSYAEWRGSVCGGRGLMITVHCGNTCMLRLSAKASQTLGTHHTCKGFIYKNNINSN